MFNQWPLRLLLVHNQISSKGNCPFILLDMKLSWVQVPLDPGIFSTFSCSFRVTKRNSSSILRFLPRSKWMNSSFYNNTTKHTAGMLEPISISPCPRLPSPFLKALILTVGTLWAMCSSRVMVLTLLSFLSLCIWCSHRSKVASASRVDKSTLLFRHLKEPLSLKPCSWARNSRNNPKAKISCEEKLAQTFNSTPWSETSRTQVKWS